MVAVAACAAVLGGWLYLTLAGDAADRAVVAEPPPLSSAAEPAKREGAEISLARQGQAPSAATPAPRTGPSAPPAQIPQPVAESFDNWRVQCVLDAQGREECRVEQLLVARDGQLHLAVIVQAPLAGEPARLRVLPPWGALIRTGLVIQIDAAPAFDMPILTCFPSGCRAEAALTPAQLQALQSGTSLLIGMVDSRDGQAVTTTVPLQGFAQAYARMTALTAR